MDNDKTFNIKTYHCCILLRDPYDLGHTEQQSNMAPYPIRRPPLFYDAKRPHLDDHCG